MFYEAQLGSLHRYCTINTTYPQQPQPQQKLSRYQQQMFQPPQTLHYHELQPQLQSQTGSYYHQPRETVSHTQPEQNELIGPETASHYVANYNPDLSQ